MCSVGFMAVRWIFLSRLGKLAQGDLFAYKGAFLQAFRTKERP
ncbi:hypothetical protein MPNT_20188 [Candidatus Methylacidithermus pantelleriae]|uniref:Uncharacterized protein n=1 Tax=Candidatus Methylacidithermus pantelleriae TaxID=2744239 RepID=A0A8J2FW09_9BACT|nr:hypothetical protein MPNT_20188 [Candidatus Methylacidithermus pantelleriae]